MARDEDEDEDEDDDEEYDDDDDHHHPRHSGPMSTPAQRQARPPLEPQSSTGAASSTSNARSISANSQQGGASSHPSIARGSSYFSNPSSAPSPALSAVSASSYDGSAYESDFDSDLNALSLDDLDPDAPLGSPLHRAQRRALRRTSSRDSGETEAAALGQDIEAEEEALGESGSAAFDVADEDEADMHAEGVPAAWGYKLDARLWETSAFRAAVLELLSNRLKIAGWVDKDVRPALKPLNPDFIHLKRMSGAMSNAVFFVSYRPDSTASRSSSSSQGQPPAPETATPPPTVLLRLYGSGTEVLLSRRAELLILHTLSSLYSIGPHILGTFANGRVEEYFDCVPIGKDGLRALGDRGGSLAPQATKEAELAASLHGKEGTAQWVARRMRELHEVPLDVMRTVLERGNLHAPGPKGFGRGIENHIMASSHRPRRQRTPPRPSIIAGSERTPPSTKQITSHSEAPTKRHDSATADTSFAAIAANGAREQASGVQRDEDLTSDYLNIPARPSLAGSNAEDTYTYGQGRNNSVASFDSLATSYNSHTSSFSGSDAAASTLFASGPASPWPFGATNDASSNATSHTSYGSSVDGLQNRPGTFIGFTSPKSPFMVANKSTPPKPGGIQRQVSALDALEQHQRRPYPGVWRRMKRWSREAGKVIGLVDAFCSTPEGRAAAERALGFPLQELGVRASTWNSRQLGPTQGNLGNALRAIAAIDLASFVLSIDAYKEFVRRFERREGQSKRVFSHNDSQYGNLLIKKSAQQSSVGRSDKGSDASKAGAKSSGEGTADVPGRDAARGMPRERSGSIIGPGSASPSLGTRRSSSRSSSKSRREPPHHALVVIDFEYAAPNPRGFDIANHFHEWRTDYDHPTLSWSLTHHGAYPTPSERRRWLRAYVEQGRFLRLRVGTSKLPAPEAPPAAVQSSSQIVKSPKAMPASLELDDLEALPPPAMPVAEDLSSASQETQRAALERSSGIRPGMSRAPSSNPSSVQQRDEGTPPAKAAAASPPTPSSKAQPTTSRGPGRTIKVANSPALQALYSPTLSPYIGPLTSIGETGSMTASAPASASSSSLAAHEASAALAKLETSIEKEVDRLEREVWLWSPACNALWALWGVVFAKEDIETMLRKALESPSTDAGSAEVVKAQAGNEEGSEGGSFDYLRHALNRVELFREETASMKIQPTP